MAGWVRELAWTGDRTVPAGFESHCGKLRFGTLAIPFTALCQCLSEEILKLKNSRSLLPGGVKDPTSPPGNGMCTLSWTPPLFLEKDHSKNNPVTVFIILKFAQSIRRRALFPGNDELVIF